jgi:enoyl-CoA hydratase
LATARKSTQENSVLVQQTGPALVITINRPEAGNSVTLDVARAVSRALRSCRGRKGILAVILTGAGERFFCTGGDLKAYRALQTRAQMAQAFGRVRKLLDEIEACDLPVIAAINGYALGGGADLALACDVRISSPGMQIGLVQTKIGLISGWNGIERLVETVGRATAMRMLLTAEQLTASQALAAGMVDIVAKRPVVEEALRFVERFRDVGPLTLAATKRAVLAALRRSPREARRVSARLFEKLWFTADHREAELAFVEKRRPQFRGA